MRSASRRRRSGASRRQSRSTRISRAPGSGSRHCAASCGEARPSTGSPGAPGPGPRPDPHQRWRRHRAVAEPGSVSERAWLGHRTQGGRLEVAIGGGWTVAELAQLDDAGRAMLEALPGEAGPARIELGAREALDTPGAWLVCRIQTSLAERGWRVELAGAAPVQAALLAEIGRLKPQPALPPPRLNPFVRLLARLGASTISAGDEARRLLSFYGETIVTLARLALQPGRLRFTSLVHHLEQTCLNAL